MSENLKNIDIIYRKELRNYSQSAPDDVWGNIEQELTRTKKKSYLSFYKIAAAIISLTLIGSVYLYLNKNNNIENLPIAENQPKNEIVTKPEIKEQIAIVVKEEKALTEEKIESKVFNPEVLLAENRIKVDEEGVINQEEARGSAEKVYTKLDRIELHPILMVFESADRGIVDNRNAKVKSILNSIPYINNTLALDNFSDKPIQENNKWAIGGEFSPLYSYRHISGTPNKEFYDDVESSVVAYTGGLNFQYKPLKRLTVQLGVYYSTMGQALDNISIYENSAFSLVPEEYKDRYINEYSLDNSTGGINLNSAYIFVDERADRVSDLSKSKSNVDLSNPVFHNLEAEIQQTFQYIEVPFLLRYKLIDKLIDVNFVGGVGANFLIGNDVYLAYGDNKENIGYTEGVSDINYNGTVGLGIEYPLLKRINIRFEPSIKYYLNEINPDSHVESHPYSLGFYTGINYSF
jgi:Outer membrane protein beta-barrel domain